MALKEVTAAYSRADLISFDNDEIHPSAVMQRATEAILRRLCQGTLCARPKFFEYWMVNDPRHLVLPEMTIPRSFWQNFRRLRRQATEDWIVGDFAFEEDLGWPQEISGEVHGVEFDRNGLPLVADEGDLLKDRNLPVAAKAKAGAPRKWDWDGALLDLAARAHCSPDGLYRADGEQPNQSDIANRLERWFLDQRGEAPESSQLRKYGQRFDEQRNAILAHTANNVKAAC